MAKAAVGVSRISQLSAPGDKRVVTSASAVAMAPAVLGSSEQSGEHDHDKEPDDRSVDDACA